MGSWEYSGDPTTSPKDEVRFLLGDVDDDEHQMSDEEIGYLLTTYGDPTAAAAAGARALSSKYARAAVSSKQVGDLVIQYRSQADSYATLAETLGAAGGTTSTVRPIAQATGIRQSQVDSAHDDDDRISEEFRMGMDDIEGAWPPDASIINPPR